MTMDTVDTVLARPAPLWENERFDSDLFSKTINNDAKRLQLHRGFGRIMGSRCQRDRLDIEVVHQLSRQ